jgi:predicted pyridoxine 5'-phosphate oxidase superfamily flavin-nucleotide-binding protein
MNDFFGPEQRALQDRFQTRALADTVSAVTVHEEVQDADRAFIESRDMFFLSTVDAHGQPSCSYKGGDPGFVRVVDGRTIAFPSYDGNGMFLSMGNLAATAKVGLLFIDFEVPNRLRLHGDASIAERDPLLAEYPGAELIVRVAIKQLFANCPRYIHRYQKLAGSHYVPRAGVSTPLAQWKRIDLLQDALVARDRAQVAEVGAISFDEYSAKAARGEG